MQIRDLDRQRGVLLTTCQPRVKNPLFASHPHQRVKSDPKLFPVTENHVSNAIVLGIARYDGI